MTSVQHDLPQVLSTKNQVIKAYHHREKRWKDIYDAMHSVPTSFANKTSEKQIEVVQQSEENSTDQLESSTEIVCPLNPHLLYQTYGDCVLRRQFGEQHTCRICMISWKKTVDSPTG